MCGLAGVVIGQKHRTPTQLAEIEGLFRDLLRGSEHRGRDATGVAKLQWSGDLRIAKAPLPASAFVRSDIYREWSQAIDPQTTLLMGHTRLPTQGSPLNPDNNHPLAGSQGLPLILTHNGHIPGVDQVFQRFGIEREWEVDSEILLKLALRRLKPDGLDFLSLLQDLERCPGAVAAVIASPAHPGTVYFLRRERPLCLAFHSGKHLLAYASEEAILERTLHHPGWCLRSVPPFRAWSVSCANPGQWSFLPLLTPTLPSVR